MAGRDFSDIRVIRAAVVRQKDGPLNIEKLYMKGPQDDEALVRTVATGVCHTDISMLHHWDETDGPQVLGHEGAGIIEEVGRNVKSFRPGDHVILSFESCGVCAACKSGRPSQCRRFYELNFGLRRADGANGLAASGVSGHFFGQSSFATYMLATERNMVKISKALPLALLAPLGCGIQAGAGAVMNQLKIRKKESMAVFGAGAVGLAAVMAGRMTGAAPVIAVDIKTARLKLALELGATHIVDSRKSDVAAAIRKIAPDGVDYSLETTGRPSIMQLAVDMLKKGGTAAYFTGGFPDRVPRGRKAVSVIAGDAVPQKFIPRMIRWYKAGKFPFDRMIQFYDFRQINRAVKDSLQGKTVKPVLLFDGKTSR